jgi:ATP-dependent RNA helicase RhlE
MTDFQSLNLNENIISALQKKGYTHPTPIQLQAIPHILEGKDFLGIAQTGTGKTGAFALPIIHNLSENHQKNSPNQISALILTPTRELATQIADNIKVYGKNSHLTCATVFGGVSEVHQIKSLRSGVDILIATPGRLLDLTKQKYVDYSKLKILVLDEADRMLDLGFFDDVKRIMDYLPKERQSLLFSATMPPAIETLVHKILKHPVKVEVTPQSTTVEKIQQKVFITSRNNKINILNDILKKHQTGSVLIFCQMKHNANRLAQSLETLGFKNAVLHGNKSQNAREKALNDFRSNRVNILIATDIAARGIDIADISVVLNFDLPRDIENYVHRIGRTARAGREGLAISLCDTSELKALRSIEKSIGMKIQVEEAGEFENVEGSVNKGIFGVKIGRSPVQHRDRKDGEGSGDERRERAPAGRRINAPRRSEDSTERPRGNFERRERSDDQPRGNFGRRREDSADRSRNNFGRSREDSFDRPRGNFGRRDREDSSRDDNIGNVGNREGAPIARREFTKREDGSAPRGRRPDGEYSQNRSSSRSREDGPARFSKGPRKFDGKERDGNQRDSNGFLKKIFGGFMKKEDEGFAGNRKPRGNFAKKPFAKSSGPKKNFNPNFKPRKNTNF